MRWRNAPWACAVAGLLVGCHSPYAQDRLAGAGALLGAGTGAIIGSQGGHAGEGALIGGALGAIGGAVTGNAIDDAEARNRGLIESRTAGPVAAGGVTVNDLVTMTQNGVPEDVIIGQIENRGMAQEVGPSEVSYLTSCRVSPRVMMVAQRPPTPLVVRGPRPRTVIVDDPWGPPCWHYRPYYCRPPPPVLGLGFSYSHHHHR